MAVNKRNYWIGYQFKERSKLAVNLSQSTSRDFSPRLSLSNKTKSFLNIYSFSLPFVSLRDRGLLNNHRSFIDFFFYWQLICLFLWIYCHCVSFSEFTDIWPFSSNILLSVYFLFHLFSWKWLKSVIFDENSFCRRQKGYR